MLIAMMLRRALLLPPLDVMPPRARALIDADAAMLLTRRCRACVMLFFAYADMLMPRADVAMICRRLFI